MSRSGLHQCERCKVIVTSCDGIFDLDGHEGWGLVCEDCKDMLGEHYDGDEDVLKGTAGEIDSENFNALTTDGYMTSIKNEVIS